MAEAPDINSIVAELERDLSEVPDNGREILLGFIRGQLEALAGKGELTEVRIREIREALMIIVGLSTEPIKIEVVVDDETTGPLNEIATTALAHNGDPYRHGTGLSSDIYHTAIFGQIERVFDQYHLDETMLAQAVTEKILPLIRGEQKKGLLAALKRRLSPSTPAKTLSVGDLAEIAQMFKDFPEVDRALALHHAEKLDENTRMLLLVRLGRDRENAEAALALLTRGEVTLEHKEALLKNPNIIWTLMNGDLIQELTALILSVKDGTEKELEPERMKALRVGVFEQARKVFGEKIEWTETKDHHDQVEGGYYENEGSNKKFYEFARFYAEISSSNQLELEGEVVTEIIAWMGKLPRKNVHRSALDKLIEDPEVFQPEFVTFADAIGALFYNLFNRFLRFITNQFHDKYLLLIGERETFYFSNMALQSGNRIVTVDPLVKALFEHPEISDESLADLAAALPLVDLLSIFQNYLRHPNATPQALAVALDRALPALTGRGQMKALRAGVEMGNMEMIGKLVQNGDPKIQALAKRRMEELASGEISQQPALRPAPDEGEGKTA